MSKSHAVLGIDAAWGARAPSGIALLASSPSGGWHAWIAPSAHTFTALAVGDAVDWTHGRFSGGAIDIRAVLDAARALCGSPVSCVGVDMPLAKHVIAKRRPCDDLIASAYVGTHSPLPGRPGRFGRALQRRLEGCGFSLAVAGRSKNTAPALLEVYPHAALMELLGLEKRFEYKVSRSSRYWPELSTAERASRLVRQWRMVLKALRRERVQCGGFLPRADQVQSLARLKAYEDALDALICAWVGTRYLEGRAEPYGDDSAAIWVPKLN